jgi:hypothetical protein
MSLLYNGALFILSGSVLRAGWSGKKMASLTLQYIHCEHNIASPVRHTPKNNVFTLVK